MKSKTPEYFTPPGVAVYPWLNKPDTKFNKSQWKCNVRYEANDPAWVKFQAKVDAWVDASYEDAVKRKPALKKVIRKVYPYVMETDEDGEETGSVLLKTKQNTEITYTQKDGSKKTVEVSVDLFDKHLHPIDREKTAIYAGSTVICKLTMRYYFMESSKEAGINLDLKAVQVVKLVTSGQTTRSGEDHGFSRYDDEDAEEPESDGFTRSGETPEEAEQDPTDF